MGKLFEQLKQYENAGWYPFHMPGHKRKEIQEGLPYGIDITEITGFDNLHHPEGVIKKLLDKMKAMYQTKQSYMLINGTTCGLLAGISACCGLQEEILIARNCHKAVYQACDLLGLKVHYLYPDLNEEYGIFQGINPLVVREQLTKHPNIKCVVVTSPNYEGVVLNIEEIAKVVHEFQIPLLVDEAHGAHLPFMEPDYSAVYHGADLVVESLHKTLPAFTQTAVFHIVDDQYVKIEQVQKYLALYQTSSPSYILMASVDQCMDYCANADIFANYKEYLIQYREQLKTLKYLHVVENEVVDQNCKGYDLGKLVIATTKSNISGYELFEYLQKYKIECEMAQENYVVAMTSICDTKDGYDRLFQALVEIDNTIQSGKNAPFDMLYGPQYVVDSRWSMNEVNALPKTWINIEKCSGETSGEYIYLYPPGIPVIVPGEVFTEELTTKLIKLSTFCGKLNVIGLDLSNSKVCIVDNSLISQ